MNIFRDRFDLSNCKQYFCFYVTIIFQCIKVLYIGKNENLYNYFVTLRKIKFYKRIKTCPIRKRTLEIFEKN